MQIGGLSSNVRVTVLLILCLAAVVAVIYPVFMKPEGPKWAAEGRMLLYEIAKAIRMYANEHAGHAPNRLADLYPKYIEDSRVCLKYINIGGENVSVEYNKPRNLGNKNEVILELRLPLHEYSDERQHSVKLFGDLHVQSQM